MSKVEQRKGEGDVERQEICSVPDSNPSLRGDGGGDDRPRPMAVAQPEKAMTGEQWPKVSVRYDGQDWQCTGY